MAGPARLLIVDDHPLFREALAAALAAADGRVASAEIRHAGDLPAALEAVREEPPDLVLLDLHLGDIKGLEGLQRLRLATPDTAIAVVSAADASQTVAAAKALGAAGFLPKSLAPSVLQDAVADLLDGKAWFPALPPEGDIPDSVRRLAELTPAQRRVLEGLSAGLLNKQIAHAMGISDATVKAHMTAIMRKLGATNRTQALLVYRDALSTEE